MCGRLTEADPRRIAEEFGLDAFALGESARFNVAPTQSVPALIREGRFEMLRWGLIPSWAKDPGVGSRMINARAETLETKPAFREALGRRRCLVLADGFYEWKRSQKGKKQPFYLRLHGGQPFACAGLWDEWKSPEGLSVRSCTIVTTEANAVVHPIHDRMPVILDRTAQALWLSTDVSDLADLIPILAPFPSHSMEAFPVSTDVNSAQNDRPELIQPALASALDDP